MNVYTTEQVDASILLSIKKMLGYEPDYAPFDIDLMIFINSQMANLYQLGVKRAKTCYVSGPDVGWSKLVSAEDTRLQFIKTYVYAKVKMLHDPPTSTAQMQALKEAAAEAEFRILVAVDTPYDDLDPDADTDPSPEDPDTPVTPVDPEYPTEGYDHSLLSNRDAPDQHPIEAITNLSEKLEGLDDDLDDKLDPDDALSTSDIDEIISRAK